MGLRAFFENYKQKNLVSVFLRCLCSPDFTNCLTDILTQKNSAWYGFMLKNWDDTLLITYHL
jgi:hypothetical protein